MSPLLYFWLFLKASLFSTGGLGNLPFLHSDLIGLGWASEANFVTALAVGQLSPGPTGTWSISLGYLTYGWPGAGLALAGLCLPPLTILLVSAFYSRLEHQRLVQDFMRGMALGIAGLTITVALDLAGTTIVDWGGVLIAAGALALALSKKVPIILVLALAALAGLILYGR